MYLTQEQIDTLTQNLRKKRLKIELLNDDYQLIDSMEGYAIGGSITANANNSIRRSGNIQLAIPINHSATTLLDQLDGLTIDIGGKIWLDKRIKISIGIDDIITGKTIWYKLGVFLINKPQRNFSANDFSISFECIDLMAKLTGQRQGQLTGTTTIIEKGHYETINDEEVYVKTKWKDALISTITELGGISKYSIYSKIPTAYEFLPYDIKVGVGSTVYDILKNLMDIIPTWQMYFDLDGVFIVEPIPSGTNAIVYDLDDEHYISNNLSVDFENVKNQVVVYGRTNTLSYYTENTEEEPDNVQYENDTLILKYSTISQESLTISGTTFGFMSLPQPNAQPITKVEIWSGNQQLIYTHDNITISLVKFENSTKSFGIEYNSTQIEQNTILQNEIYFIRIYDASLINEDNYVDITKDITFEFMGKQSVSYTMINDNKESPFYINNNIKEENYYADMATTPTNEVWGQKYNLTLNDDNNLTTLNNGTVITFIANAPNLSNATINIFNANGVSLKNDLPIVKNFWNTNVIPAIREPIDENKIANDYTIWQLRYENINNNEWLVLVGRNNCALTKIFSSEEYDNIYADQLAYERCLWELFNCSNLNDNISLNVVPNYLIDVNNKIIYNQENSLPKNIYDVQEFSTLDSEDQTKYEKFVTSDNQIFYVKKTDDTQYFLTKQITYPLGVSSTPQSISAIKIFDSGNLVGED